MDDPYPSRRRSEPLLIERHDPVTYANDLSSAPIPPSLVRSYAGDGFMVLEDVFSNAEIAALKGHAEKLRNKPGGLAPETVITEADKTRGRRVVRSVFAIHRQSEIFAGLARDQRLAGLARFLLGDEVYIHQSRLNYKPAFRGKEFFWHSDFETWHTEDGMPRMRALSMSVMLTGNHPQAGPTMFIPGSHRSFAACVGETPADHYKTSLRKQEYGIPDDGTLRRLQDRGGLTAPAPKAGSVVVFDCNTMHGSNGNITPLERINAFFVFNAWSNRLTAPFGGTRPRPWWVAEREPAAPLAYPDQSSHRAA